MSKVKLSERLAIIAGYVLENKVFADIGTDHGLIACHLLSEGICPRGIATDKVRGPLRAAAENAALYGVEDRLELRLGDGFDILEPGEAKTIIIAGMGGELMVSILERAVRKITDGTERFVLQPNISAFKVRNWAVENGWRIKAEDLVRENKRYYEIIVLEGRGVERIRDEELYLGPRLLEDEHRLLVPYWRERFKAEDKVINQMLKAKKAVIDKKAEEIIKKQERLKKELSWRLDAEM